MAVTLFLILIKVRKPILTDRYLFDCQNLKNKLIDRIDSDIPEPDIPEPKRPQFDWSQL